MLLRALKVNCQNVIPLVLMTLMKKSSRSYGNDRSCTSILTFSTRNCLKIISIFLHTKFRIGYRQCLIANLFLSSPTTCWNVILFVIRFSIFFPFSPNSKITHFRLNSNCVRICISLSLASIVECLKKFHMKSFFRK